MEPWALSLLGKALYFLQSCLVERDLSLGISSQLLSLLKRVVLLKNSLQFNATLILVFVVLEVQDVMSQTGAESEHLLLSNEAYFWQF